MNILPNIIIFSVYQKHVNQEHNELAHKRILQALTDKGIPCMELKGRYDGHDEKSILVEGFEHRELVEHTCMVFGQACYLESHNDRESFLVYPNGIRVKLGKLIEVDKDEALAAKGYSYNPVVGKYFITRAAV